MNVLAFHARISADLMPIARRNFSTNSELIKMNSDAFECESKNLNELYLSRSLTHIPARPLGFMCGKYHSRIEERINARSRQQGIQSLPGLVRSTPLQVSLRIVAACSSCECVEMR
jgi:hypothetical protein